MSTSFDALFSKSTPAGSNTSAKTPANPYDAANQPNLSGSPANSTQTSFSALFNNQPAPAKDSGKTSFSDLFKPDANPYDAANRQPSSFDALFKSDTLNPLTSLSEDERKASTRPDPENNEDEPWYSRTWSWMNKPLWDLHQYGTRTGAGTFERGVESGAEDLISGLTSPLSIALTIGTFGEGTLAKVGLTGAAETLGAAPATLLRAVGVSREAAPFVARGAKALMDLGFTGQALNGLITQSPQFLDALKEGDTESAARIGTNILANLTLTAAGTTKTFEDAGVVKDAVNGKTASQIETLKTAKKIAGNLDLANTVASERARNLANELTDNLKTVNALDPTTQGAIVHYLEAQGDTQLLKDQHDALAGTLQVKQTPKVSTEVLDAKTKDFGSQGNLERYISEGHAGDAEDAKRELSKRFDIVRYTDESGNEVTIPVKPIDQIPTKYSWNKDYVYHATDKSTADMVRNAGVRIDKLGAGSDTPGEALSNAALPASGDRSDLRVFAVPRSEMESSTEPRQFVYRSRDEGEEGIPSQSRSQATFSQDEAKTYLDSRGKVTGKRQELVRVDLGKLDPKDYTVMEGPNQNKWVKFNRDLSENEVESGKFNPRHIMPSHEVVVDSFLPKDGSDDLEVRPTGQVVSLRPDSEHSLTLNNSRFNEGYTPQEKEQLLAQYKAAQNLTPEQKAIAEKLRNFYDGEFNRAHKEGIIRQAVEGYHPRAWANDRPGFFQNLFGATIDPAENPAYNKLRHQTDNGAFDTNINAAKHRAFETRFQGEMAGLKSDPTNLAHAAANYQNHLDRAIAARQFLDDMRASGAKAADGRPLVALEGSSRIIGQESGNPALLVNPQATRDIAISNHIVKALMDRGELEDLYNSGKIDKLPFNRDVKDPKTGEVTKIPAYAWSTGGYATIDHPSMRDWQYIGKDTAGNNALMKARMQVHPDAADYVKQVVGADKSAIAKNPYGRAALALSREAKGSLLALSPFHAAQEGLRGAMIALGSIGNEKAMAPWMDWNPAHVEGDPLLSLGVKNNLTLGSDYRAEAGASEGLVSHSKLIGAIPGINHIQDMIQRLTFDKIIPGLKARAFKSVYYRFLDKMPGASADEVAHAAATYVNDAFGGQHWRDLHVGATGQDIMRLTALAPDWLTSEARMLYRAAGGMGKAEGSIARSDMLRLTAGLYMTARILNLLTTGKAHPEAPLGVVIPGKNGEDDKVYSMRTLPTDLIHAVSDPRGFVSGRLNPLTVKPAIEIEQGRNERGQKIPASQVVEDTFRNVIPIGVQGLLKGNVPGGPTNLDQLIKASGATVYKYRTEAEKLAQEKASDHTPTGQVEPAALEKHQKRMVLEDSLRNGEISRGDVYRSLPQREANEVIENSRMTPLQARFNRLPLNDAVDVWALATPTERDELHKLLWDKRRSYIQNHTPAQRNEDPVWLKLQSVYADLHGR